MVQVMKHEWHQVDSQFTAEIDEELVSRIYPELDDVEIAAKLQALEEGDIGVEEIIQDAYDNNVDIDWDRDYDDWWTERKGGFEVTYELSEVEFTETVDEAELAKQLEELKAEFDALTSHTHHCTECDWTGNEADHEKEGICPNCCAYTEKYEDGNS